jgi:hypothetical protein
MSFMQPEVYESDYLYVDGPWGGEVIPCDVVDYTPTEGVWFDHLLTRSSEPGWTSDPPEQTDIPPELKDYCNNKTAWSIARQHGWVGRMQAPGYLDCTDWESADSEAELVEQLKEYHGCTECGEFEDDCMCGKEQSDA